jgi:hypothetical protein
MLILVKLFEKSKVLKNRPGIFRKFKGYFQPGTLQKILKRTDILFHFQAFDSLKMLRIGRHYW